MTDISEYTIGWICAIKPEYVAAQEFLDEEHPKLASQDANDNNIYTLGSMGNHKVAIACLPHGNYGLVSAATVARDMLRTFPNIRFGLMVGIAGGVPTMQDIRLGDIVVSSRNSEKGAVFQHDFGKTIQGQDTFKWTQHQDAPPLLLQAAITNLQVKHERKGNRIDEAVTAVLDRNKQLQGYRRLNPTTDRLYRSDFVHVGKSDQSCASCCGFDEKNLISRPPRSEDDDNPKVHYGLIASGNQVMRDAKLRDDLAKKHDILCFEMEAAGLMNHFKCLVIRGISNYSDSHKSDEWQGYAAMTATAYAKELLTMIVPSKVETHKTLSSILTHAQEGDETLRKDTHFKNITMAQSSQSFFKSHSCALYSP